MGNRWDKKKELVDDREESVEVEDRVDPASTTSSVVYNKKIKEFADREMQRAKRKSAPAFFDSDDIQKLFGQTGENRRASANTDGSGSGANLFRRNMDNDETFRFYGRSEMSPEVLKNMLVECRERLSRYYRTENIYMRSYVWEGRGYDFPLTPYSVPFGFENGDSCGRRKKEEVQLKDLLEKSGRRMVLVTAGPGFGKSTLCMKVAQDWAQQEPGYLKHFDVAIVVRLCALREKRVVDAMIDAVLLDSEKEIVAELKRMDLHYLVLLDGYDECSRKSAVHQFIKTDSFLVSKNITILITSRPHAARDIRDYVDECVSISGFSKENQKTYVERFDFAIAGKNREHANGLLVFLDENRWLFGLAECPLFLHMLCCLHWERSINKIERKTDLFVWLFSHVMYRYVRKKEGKSAVEIGDRFLGESSLLKLGRLAWNCLFSNRPLLSADLYGAFPDGTELQMILGLDILVYTRSTFEGRETGVFEPVHKALFQFLSALHVSSSQPSGLDLLVKCIFDEDIFLFVCGLIDESQIPDSWLDYPLYNGFEASFLRRVRTEMSNEATWDTFCSKVHAKFSYASNETLESVLSDSKIEKIFLTLPEFRCEYENLKSRLVNGLRHCQRVKRLRIYVYVVVSSKFSLANYLLDIREHASMVLDLLSDVEAEDCEILVNGVNFFEMYFPFVDVQTVSRDGDESPIGIEAAQNSVGLKIDQGNVFLVSADQYQILRKHIGIRPSVDR